jgi:hypothetical protein
MWFVARVEPGKRVCSMRVLVWHCGAWKQLQPAYAPRQAVPSGSYIVAATAGQADTTSLVSGGTHFRLQLRVVVTDIVYLFPSIASAADCCWAVCTGCTL